MPIPIIPQDKANHVVYGAVVFLIAASATRLLGHPSNAIKAGLLAVACIALLKELTDYTANRRAVKAGQPPPHSVELLDVVATVAGGLLCWAAVAVVGAGHG